MEGFPIISSWLMEEGQKPLVITSYITTFCPTSSNIYIGIFSGGLLQHFIGIAILVRLADKITLARVPAAC